MISPSRHPPATASGRLVSLDAFRGLTIVLMILVNNPGDWSQIYPPLRHAAWHGCTPTDLVFPFFLFIVGVAIALALTKRRAEQVGRGRLAWHILRRSAVLFGLGLFLAGYSLLFQLGDDFGWRDLLASIRIPGVLQRIAVCYLCVSLLFLFAPQRLLYVSTAALLLGYWMMMVWVPVPGYGAGQIDACDTHLAAYIDREVFGARHLWSGAKTWDPEGLLSTLPAVATTLFGLLAGQWLLCDRPLTARMRGLLLGGIVGTAIGWAWGLLFPINKQLWTSSYAVYTAGLALLVLALCVYLFDVRGWIRWAGPLRVYGVNAITVFVLSGMVGRFLTGIRVAGKPLKTLIYEHLFCSWLDGENASLAYAIAWVLAWYFVLAWMYRRNWVIKI